MLLPALILLIDLDVQAPSGQLVMGACDVALHASRHDHEDPDAVGREFDAEGVAVGVQCGLGGVVDGAEDVGHDGSEATDLDDGAFGSDKEGAEGLAEKHDGIDVGGEGEFDFGDVDVEGGDGVVAAAVVLGLVCHGGERGRR